MPSPEQSLVDALTARCSPGEPEGLSVRALMAKTGFGRLKVLSMLKALSDEGRLECVRAPTVGIDGRTISIPVYRIKSPEAPRGKK